jgi:hypothetical protein
MRPTTLLVLLLCLSERHAAASVQRAASVRHAATVRRAAVPLMLAPQWEDIQGGCQLLRTPRGVAPRGLVHFLGGVLVSPSPQNAYRYVLESLSRRGYLVVATPFAVEFDYRVPAATIHEKYGRAKAAVEREYGELPQLAMGHSLGALMQTLLCCTYAEYADACTAAALLSYNNKPASDAIPAFEQLFVPALAPLEPLTREFPAALSSVQSLRGAGFDMLRAGLEKSPFRELAPAGVNEAAAAALRDAEALAALTDQVPEVLAQISRGASEFTPTPTEMRALVASAFTVEGPLVVQFSDDGLDESPALEAALPASVGARLLPLQGTHLTPLAVDPDAPSSALLPIPDALGPGVRDALLGDADALLQQLDDYFTAQLAAAAAKEAAAKEAAAKEAEASGEDAEAAAARAAEAAKAAKTAEEAAWLAEEAAAAQAAMKGAEAAGEAWAVEEAAAANAETEDSAAEEAAN